MNESTDPSSLDPCRMDRFPEDNGCDMAWSLVAIEFVSWSVLGEAGSSQELAETALEKAYEANPFLAWYIAYRDIFEEVREGFPGIVVDECEIFSSRAGRGLLLPAPGAAE